MSRSAKNKALIAIKKMAEEESTLNEFLNRIDEAVEKYGIDQCYQYFPVRPKSW